jgi:hypothetical protein
MHLACANVDPREKPGTHWVALRLSLSWEPKVNPLIHRKVRAEASSVPRAQAPASPTLSPKPPPPVSVPRPVDAKLRALFGTYTYRELERNVTYAMTRIPISRQLSHNKLQPDMVLDSTNSLVLVWVLEDSDNGRTYVRHVIVGPSSVCDGQGLYLWCSNMEVGSKLGMYTGTESRWFVTQALAEAHAKSMTPKQRNYSLLRKRGDGWVVVDASESSAEGFLTFVNDPHKQRTFANTYFTDHAVLRLKTLTDPYDLTLPHEANSAAELLCKYRPDDGFFPPAPASAAQPSCTA